MITIVMIIIFGSVFFYILKVLMGRYMPDWAIVTVLLITFAHSFLPPAALIVVIFVVCTLAGWLFYMSAGARRRQRISISKQRSAFLGDIFDIDLQECKSVGFDGYKFVNQANASETDYEFIELVKHRKRDPPETRYEHENLDGGPDLRYKNNKIIPPSNPIFSYAHIRLSGKKEHTFVLSNFDVPKDLRETIEKFNRFLVSNNNGCINDIYDKYVRLYEEIRSLKKKIEICGNRIRISNRHIREVESCIEPGSSDYSGIVIKRINSYRKDIESQQAEIKKYEGKLEQASSKFDVLVSEARSGASNLYNKVKIDRTMSRGA